MQLQTIFSLLIATTASASSFSVTTIANVSFGLDPLVIQSSSGNGVISSAWNDPANAHSGSGYLSISFPASTTLVNNDRQYIVFVYPYRLLNRTAYTASFWSKASGSHPGNCYASIGLHNNAGALINITEGVKITNNYVKHAITVQSGAQYDGSGGAAYFYLSCLGGLAEKVFVDDFELSAA